MLPFTWECSLQSSTENFSSSEGVELGRGETVVSLNSAFCISGLLYRTPLFPVSGIFPHYFAGWSYHLTGPLLSGVPSWHWPNDSHRHILVPDTRLPSWAALRPTYHITMLCSFTFLCFSKGVPSILHFSIHLLNKQRLNSYILCARCWRCKGDPAQVSPLRELLLCVTRTTIK